MHGQMPPLEICHSEEFFAHWETVIIYSGVKVMLQADFFFCFLFLFFCILLSLNYIGSPRKTMFLVVDGVSVRCIWTDGSRDTDWLHLEGVEVVTNKVLGNCLDLVGLLPNTERLGQLCSLGPCGRANGCLDEAMLKIRTSEFASWSGKYTEEWITWYGLRSSSW